jgi:hypothetical protein
VKDPGLPEGRSGCVVDPSFPRLLFEAEVMGPELPDPVHVESGREVPVMTRKNSNVGAIP